MLKQKADPNAADVDGTTPLIWAAHNGDSETGKLLIAAGANVKATNRYGVSALVEAATLGDVAMMEALLKGGADPNSTYGAGETPLMLASRTGNLNAVKLLKGEEPPQTHDEGEGDPRQPVSQAPIAQK